ncbi:hypothetical protein BDN72DRAFT_846550 [Pluteus cervinus]|uniref:Uncharacterized protein n=1 Tax=Pluteus cervinus TaxID=181527 RepID=A0ACD3AF33_9AGAR|nr:hypothetical protein BDN72DRAFT_846550 [Pluteus cervinus]
MKDEELDPRFPLEIEHKIFVIAFYDDLEMKDIANLLSVSKYVYEWLIPLVYEIVISYPNHTWPPMGFSPENLLRYGKYIRHLLLSFGNELYLSHCPNIVNLCVMVWDDTPNLIPALSSMKIKELAINLGTLPHSPELFQLCANITHLDCVPQDWDHFIGPSGWIPHFRNLTHLMVPASEREGREIVEEVLQQLAKIQVFIICGYSSSGTEVKELDAEIVYDDPRVVRLLLRFPSHWKTAAQGGLSQWKFAEEIVDRRRKKVST